MRILLQKSLARSPRLGRTLLILLLGMGGLLWIAEPAYSQGPEPGIRTRPGNSFWESPWWSNRLVEDLNLTDAQKSEISGIVKEYRGKMIDARMAVMKADSEVQIAFDENPVDQHKANEAIERLTMARADMTRTLSQMSLKLRSVLTAEQWQELQRRRSQRFERGRGPFPGGPGGPGRRFGMPPSSTTKQ